MQTTTVTQKGQITIPKALREALNIQVYDLVKITLSMGKIIIEPTKDLLDLRGTFIPKKNKKISPTAARALFEKKYTRV